jgi:hypothetical protein
MFIAGFQRAYMHLSKRKDNSKSLTAAISPKLVGLAAICQNRTLGNKGEVDTLGWVAGLQRRQDVAMEAQI